MFTMNHRAAPPSEIPRPPANPLVRKEALRESLQTTVDLLKQRRADLIDEAVIAEYIALDWLEWHGGGLRLTTVGSNICLQRRVR
jgi:hypothetical protein